MANTDAFRRDPPEPQDLERLAADAYLAGRDEESEAAWERAHASFLQRGSLEDAARAAFWLAFGLQQRGAYAPASGWLARAARLLDDGHIEECVVRGYLLIPRAIARVAQGAPAEAHELFDQAGAIAAQFRDRHLASVARHGQGRALIRLGQVADGVALLDEAMSAVLAGDVAPVLAGDIYCSVLEACQELFDLRRALQWTDALARWCAGQPGLVRYRGECLLYRAEILQLRGRWSEAADDAQKACELLMSRPAAGAAFYRVAELHRLHGDLAAAETAYARASARGRRPQPGLSLLRAAQGDSAAAAQSVRNALLDTTAQAPRARLLAAAVDLLLAVGDVQQARAAAAELSDISRTMSAPLLVAAADHAAGAVKMGEGDLAGALACLRRAREIWRELEMPYEEARTCLLLSRVHEQLARHDDHVMERANATRLFAELGADASAAGVAAASGRAGHQAGPLSDRELQVLRLLADGRTNRGIGEALFISEKTVARHVSNIFDKLHVSSRAAATAWAYRRHLI